MNIIKNKDKFKIKPPLLLTQWLLAAAIIVIAAQVSLFWYRHFYQTITQAEVILVLSREVALSDIDTEKFNQVLKIHNFKITSVLPTAIKDPFKSNISE